MCMIPKKTPSVLLWSLEVWTIELLIYGAMDLSSYWSIELSTYRATLFYWAVDLLNCWSIELVIYWILDLLRCWSIEPLIYWALIFALIVLIALLALSHCSAPGIEHRAPSTEHPASSTRPALGGLKVLGVVVPHLLSVSISAWTPKARAIGLFGELSHLILSKLVRPPSFAQLVLRQVMRYVFISISSSSWRT